MDNTLISIIMPTYNRGYIIEKAIQSVIEQTYQNWELIIVDDASTDDTEYRIKKINDSRIVYVKNEENRGANYSRNRGCDLSRGDFLAFLDSDNFWTNDKLEKQINVLINCSDNVAFVFCRLKLFDKTEKIWPEQQINMEDLGRILRKRNVADTNTVLMRKSAFEKVGKFDEEMPRLQEWELFFRTIVVYQYDAIFLPDILGCGVLQPNSIGRNSRKLQDAIVLFLEKHMGYMNHDEKLTHFRRFIQSAVMDRDWQRCQEFIQKFNNNDSDFMLEAMYQLCSQTRYYETLFAWKEKMEKNKCRTVFSDFLKSDTGVIAIYGLGRWGEAVYEEMTNAGIKVSYGIDQKVKEFHDLVVIKPEEISMHIDVIIISVFQHSQEVCQMLSNYYKGKMISIEDIVLS